MRIERELLNALLKGDATASERYLADTYVFTGPDGTSLDGAKVQVYGNTAVVTYSSNDKGTYKGKDISGRTCGSRTHASTVWPVANRGVARFHAAEVTGDGMAGRRWGPKTGHIHSGPRPTNRVAGSLTASPTRMRRPVGPAGVPAGIATLS